MITIDVYWAQDDHTPFVVRSWRRDANQLVLFQHATGVPRIHIPLSSVRYYEVRSA